MNPENLPDVYIWLGYASIVTLAVASCYFFYKIMEPIDKSIEHSEELLEQFDADEIAKQNAIKAGIVINPLEQKRARNAKRA